MSELENNISRDTEDDDEEEGSCATVTMVDLLDRERELEEQYTAILGAADEKVCSYSKGYYYRQALYACLTCSPEGVNDLEKCAGICLACTYHCHDNHEFVELYTKRNFRCDCPTQRIPGTKCVLNSQVDGSNKLPNNDQNHYNQNFQGLYCTCHRPYPDPEKPGAQIMLQCIVCEDWYHLNHLGLAVKNLRDDVEEMICEGCIGKYDFLQDYYGMAYKILEKRMSTESAIVDVEGETDDKLKLDLDKSISEIMNIGSEDGDANTSEKVVDNEKVIRDMVGTAAGANKSKMDSAEEKGGETDLGEKTSDKMDGVERLNGEEKVQEESEKVNPKEYQTGANALLKPALETKNLQKLVDVNNVEVKEHVDKTTNTNKSPVETNGDEEKKNLKEEQSAVVAGNLLNTNQSWTTDSKLHGSGDATTSAETSEKVDCRKSEKAGHHFSGKYDPDVPAAKRPKLDVEADCKRPHKSDWKKGGAFWPKKWRAALCRCKKCLNMYDEKKMSFLLKNEDCTSYYEEVGKTAARETVYEQGVRALSSIGHVQKIDCLTEYNRMKDRLKEFLHTFVASKKVVTEDDINRFFEQMKGENNSNIGQPYLSR